ncbi:MAG: hypothetical protein ACI4PF_04180 [Christensenellales bacterium]
MPNINDTVVAPEYAGKLNIQNGGKEAVANIRSMFTNDSEYKIVVLDPKVTIPHAPTFFSDPQLPLDGVIATQNFTSGNDAYMASKKMIDMEKDKYIKQGNTNFNINAVILSKSPSGKPMVQGFIQAEVNNGSTNYYVANNPHPRQLRAMQPEQEMTND